MSIEFQVGPRKAHRDAYYALRERCFRRELGLPEFDGSEEDQDREGEILVALRNGQCIGGARISNRLLMPSQVEMLELDAESCCMWERFVIDPRVRTVQLVRSFCARLIDASLDLGNEHAMVLSSLRNARFYRRCHSALGVGFKIHRPVPHCAQGSFAGLEHYLSVAYLGERQPLRLAV
ncbi:MAG: hypothetical protein KDI09_10730 [Halioglobus sp.]|nr:hypothetical protein [Halioglobus sp.]